MNTTRPFSLFFGAVLAAASPVQMGDSIPPLQPMRGELPPTFWEQHRWAVLIGCVVVLGAAAILIRILRAKQPPPIPPEVSARAALDACRGLPEDAALVFKVSRILRRYIVFAFNLPPDELTTTDVRQALQARPPANSNLNGEIVDFLRRCDEKKFAPAPLVGEIGAVAGALDLVEKIEVQRKQALAPVVVSPGTAPVSSPP